ncbi:unnamed protein product [Arabis nemorensis]|uniref:Uncharacterized protein n=1 Tax=Arabis nemorensis TaxID=586526 RepID=A0A565BSL6_9BRAS|nr:unnamed protein product [Arabis nemorensis]
MELITHSNLLALSYERRVRRFVAKLEGYSAMRARAEQVLILRKRLADHVPTRRTFPRRPRMRGRE